MCFECWTHRLDTLCSRLLAGPRERPLFRFHDDRDTARYRSSYLPQSRPTLDSYASGTPTTELLSLLPCQTTSVETLTDVNSIHSTRRLARHTPRSSKPPDFTPRRQIAALRQLTALCDRNGLSPRPQTPRPRILSYRLDLIPRCSHPPSPRIPEIASRSTATTIDTLAATRLFLKPYPLIYFAHAERITPKVENRHE